LSVLTGKAENLSRKRIARQIGRAIADFGMIQSGDIVAVGLSGGKDSAFLLRSLCMLRDKSPVRFTVEAVTLDPAGGTRDTTPLREFSEALRASYSVVSYPIFEIIEKADAPCSLCANLRRGILASWAAERGCSSLALGHHRDDVVETVFLNLMYEGRFRSFQPNTLMSRSGVRVIRPLVYVAESDIRREASAMGLPIVNFCCGHEASSMRAYVKVMLRRLSKKAPVLPNNVLHALKSVRDGDVWRQDYNGE
jgi:tRNA(Ile)-lysidine synthase TilS/MesJ